MGLITKEVEVLLNGKNIRYYESIGYEIPRMKSFGAMRVPKGTKIIVPVIDLSPTSSTLVEIQCDCCGMIYKRPYAQYYTYNRQGKMYCKSCAITILTSGEKHYRWKSDKTDEERLNERCYPEYTTFIKSVLARDNYTCQCCGKISASNLVVHHLDGYNWCKEKRTDVTNGITLCDNCHNNFHSIYGHGNNTRQQYEDWLGCTIPLLSNYSGELPMARQVYDIEENKIYHSALEFAKMHKTDKTIVYSCCNHKTRRNKMILKNGDVAYYESIVHTVCGHHLMWLDEYKKMTDEDLSNYLTQCENKTYTKVVCLTTGEIFDSVAEATRLFKTEKSGITHCCQGRQNTTFSKEYSISLQWMYYKDFLELPQEKQNEILNISQ